MTERTSELRPELERLGGRTIRVIPPGESHSDFPGAVEVIVDTTGTASPPPKAVDRLSDMLMRLEDDYNRELTETIDVRRRMLACHQSQLRRTDSGLTHLEELGETLAKQFGWKIG